VPIRSRAVRVVSLAAIAMLAASCSRSLDVDGLEAELKRQFEHLYRTENLTVTCPDGVDVAAGATFECRAVEPNGATVVITVTQTDDKGQVSWSVTGASD
jgi:hypothetical protein